MVRHGRNSSSGTLDSSTSTASPATMPLASPSTVGAPRCAHSIAIQANPAVTAAVCVERKATTAIWLAPSALPALNPNHPTHNSPVPIRDSTTLCGIIGSEG